MTTNGTIARPYTQEDVERLRGSVTIEHTLARLGAERLCAAARRATDGSPRSGR